MKKIILKTNEDYFDLLNKYKEQIIIYEVTFTKSKKIRVIYDII